MLKKVIKYEDFNGEEQLAEVHLNLTRTELTKFYASYDGNFANYFQDLVTKGDINAIAQAMEEVLNISYGIKSADGMRFQKSPELLADFKQTAVYDALFMEIMGTPESFLDFLTSVVPAKVGEQVRLELKANAEAKLLAEKEAEEESSVHVAADGTRFQNYIDQ